MFEGIKSDKSQNEEFVSISDPEEAKEYIAELWKKGERPIVTVPIQYSEALKSGIRAHQTWIPGLEVIAATIGRRPYMPKDEERIEVEINGISLDRIIPRFTGPDKAFHGVVALQGPINPEEMTIH